MHPGIDQNRWRGGWPLAAGIVTLAALLRLWALGHEGLWCDEAYTALTAAKSLRGLVYDLAHYDDAAPLFYLLVKGLTALLGNSEFVLRLVPALCGIAAVVLLLTEAYRRRAAALFYAAAFLAVAPFGLFYARQAREYGLLLLLAFVLLFGARDLLLRGTRRAGARFVFAGALLSLTHHLGVLLLAASAASWLLVRRRQISLGSWALWHTLALLPSLAWWIALGSQQLQTHAHGNLWIVPFWQEHSLLLGPLLSLGIFVPGVAPGVPLQVTFPALGAGTLWQALSAAAVLLSLVVGMIGWRRQSASDPETTWPGALLPALLLLPLAALAAVSLVWSPVYVLGRTDAIAFAAFALLIGRGLARLPRRLALLFLAGWTVVAVLSLAPSYGFTARTGTLPAKGADREVARFLAAAPLRAGDLVVHGPLTAPSLEYHLGRLAAPHTAVWFPAAAGKNPAVSTLLPTDSLGAYIAEARRMRAWMETVLPPDGTVWVLALLETAAPGAHEARRAGRVRATDLRYPQNVLVYHLAGLDPQPVARFYRQDWIGGERVLLRLPRDAWLPAGELPPLRPDPGAPGAAPPSEGAHS